MMKKSVILKIHGRVQNVGFRYYTQKKAEMLDIKGFVKNMPDGSVYVEAEGDEEKVDEFIRYCHTGPSWANVTGVDIQEAPINDFQGFYID